MCTLWNAYPQVVKAFTQGCARVHKVNRRASRSRSSRSRDKSRDEPREKSRDSQSREERKEATRRRIVAAALHLLEDRSFSALSLREVTREVGIVPAAFYRHFQSMEALGLALIDESFRALREGLREARADKLDPSRVIESSVDALVDSIGEQREHWLFISRERNSGVTVLRYAIRSEIRLLTSELATDLARFTDLHDWTTEDLNVLATLFVNAMIFIAESTEDAPNPAALEELRRTAVKQLRMISLGIAGWRSVP